MDSLELFSKLPEDLQYCVMDFDPFHREAFSSTLETFKNLNRYSFVRIVVDGASYHFVSYGHHEMGWHISTLINSRGDFVKPDDPVWERIREADLAERDALNAIFG